jgi:aromatic amino acid transport protein AroP
MSRHKLTLFAAILINVNIMLGTGFFINTVVLTKTAGSLSPVVYLLVAALLLPLIVTMATLIKQTPHSGTIYDFGRHISPFFGFLSSWSYFTAKLTSTALGIHVCLSFLQKIIPFLQPFPLLILDVLAIMFFTLLNLLNLRIGKQIQFSFICLKVIPIIFVVFTGLYLFNGTHFTPDMLIWSGVPLSIPLVLYVFTGFEASCSLSTHIVDAERNGPRAIFISYGIAVAIVFLYQLFFYGSLGMYLGTLAGGYLDMFPALLTALSHHAITVKASFLPLFYIAIASSSLGSAYGIMFSNSWNLYTLAQNNHTFGKKLLTTLNEHGVPFACVIIEGLMAATYILITQGYQIPLQQVSSLGATIAYTCSSIALLVLFARKKQSLLVPVLSLISCSLLLGSFIWTLAVQGPTILLLVFLGLLIFGSFMFYHRHTIERPLEVFEEI